MPKVKRPARILIVEDSDITRDLLAEILRTQGYEVIEAIDGISGLVAARNERPDLAVLDLHLPDLCGVELAEMIQAEVAFIVLTVDRTQEYVQACIDRGALGYIVKPLQAEDFLRQIQLALSRGKERLNLRQAAQQTQTVNKALGILMGYFHLTEENAYKLLVSRATSHRVKVVDLAARITEAFHALVATGPDDPATPARVSASEFLKQVQDNDLTSGSGRPTRLDRE